ncbi:MAG: ABC transporter substrate-binding protein [Paracoccus sp. (in: a-proteobacteria)]|uniref:ABC transporter substrate-binding protein n=1 Tax=Paracoccus sp. TaxID=267 RepID=UPI0039E49AFB
MIPLALLTRTTPKGHIRQFSALRRKIPRALLDGNFTTSDSGDMGFNSTVSLSTFRYLLHNVLGKSMKDAAMALPRPIRSALAALALLGAAHGANALDLQPLVDEVPAGTVLRISDPATQRAFELTELGDDLGFDIEWANISGGPPSLEAFRAGALDGSVIADIPAIHATWTNLPVGVVDVRVKTDPIANPFTTFGIAPGVEFNSLADLKGKRIAYSPSQIHGVVVLRALAAAGLTRDDVTLIELPSKGDDYVVSLANNQVDIAPLHGILTARYMKLYERDGAKLFSHGQRDDISYFYSPQKTLEDPAKAAALAKYLAARAKATIWIQSNPETWIKEYLVAKEGLDAESGAYLVKANGFYAYPENWDEVISLHQKTIELLAETTGNKVYDAAVNFDRRFEHIASDALQAGAAGQ